jgi:DNA-binding response OmpR family regulator
LLLSIFATHWVLRRQFVRPAIALVEHLRAESAGDTRPSRKFPHCGGRSIVDADGADVPLTAMEFELISVLIRHPRQILSRDRLCQLAHNRGLAAGRSQYRHPHHSAAQED